VLQISFEDDQVDKLEQQLLWHFRASGELCKQLTLPRDCPVHVTHAGLNSQGHIMSFGAEHDLVNYHSGAGGPKSLPVRG
jgi:hypothetical protein